MFSISHDDNCSSPNTHDPSSSQIHKKIHQNLSFEEHSYALAMIMMMIMMSRVQLCWCLNSVLHLSQLCPKNLSPNFSSLHCNVHCTLYWIEMLLHCSADVQSISLLCTWLCIVLSRTPKAHNGLKKFSCWKVVVPYILLPLGSQTQLWSFSTALHCKHWLFGFHKHFCLPTVCC